MSDFDFNNDKTWYEHKDWNGNKYYDNTPEGPTGPPSKSLVCLMMAFADMFAFYIGLFAGYESGKDASSYMWTAVFLAIGVGLVGRFVFRDSFESHTEMTIAAIICAIIMAICLTVFCVAISEPLSFFGYLVLFIFAICF